MTEIRLSTRVKRVGNSLALFIPAAAARKIGLREGGTVEVAVSTTPTSPLGLAADIPYQPFERRDLWRDRV